MNWQQIYNDELQETNAFIRQNEELVCSAAHIVALGIMTTLNLFNDFEHKISITISNYYHISYAPDRDFTTDFINAGGISYGHKISILSKIAEKEKYKNEEKDPSKARSKIFEPMKVLGSTRNEIIHSSYRLDGSRLKESKPKFIIVADGRQISQKDFREILGDFEDKYNQSLQNLIELAKFLQEQEKKQNEQ